MSKTVFNKVDYDLGSLIKAIGLGEIGLPDIQRPFVWKNAKVRDLFDSMYKGYPVGYFLFWQNAMGTDTHAIGTDSKQLPPKLVIVDGQQRLTSLYAVVRSIPVIRQNFESERIQIAFNPMEEKFEVIDAAILRDKAFLPDISMLWNDETDVFEILDKYLEGLSTTRDVSDEEEKKIKSSITRLQNLMSFPFTALELMADIDEEAVSDVFVRINSKGTPLNQADFILTLMSVFWDEGRKALETFCRESRKPSKGQASPFNHFIEPSPDQMLRVGVSVAFKRAVLKYVYSILRGKDLETGIFSDERRTEQFQKLEEAQRKSLDLQYWHDFLNCIRQAGFRSGKTISSKNNLLFSYVLYLIGRTEYSIPEFKLRAIISKWFFMSAVTGRFTGSPESAMEFDLAGLRGVKTGDEFIAKLNSICDVTLTNDYWAVTLPNDLATSSSRSPSLFAYMASLVLLDANALFSKLKIADLLDPATQANRSAVERHHLFPKSYLAKHGVLAPRDTNQIANYAYLEWGDNSEISDSAPSDYFPAMKARMNGQQEVEQMMRYHALPANWEHMEYEDFLVQRRELIARVIADGYAVLCSDASVNGEDQKELNLSDLIAIGESDGIEFKSTLRTNMHTGKQDSRMEHAVLKTLAGFLNTKGGTLVVGVADDGKAVGLKPDNFASEDKLALHLVNIIKSRLGIHAMTRLTIRFDDKDDARVLVVKCDMATTPVFLKDENLEKFYIRTGPSSTELSASQVQEYIQQRF